MNKPRKYHPETEPPETKLIAWAPQPGSQTAFLQCPIFEVLYEGTRGPGKTDALIMDFGQHCGTGLGSSWRGILFRQTYKQLGDVIAKTKKWIPRIWPAASYNQQDHVWKWPGGEELLLRHFMREDDYWDYHGHEYPWIAWEELCNWSSDAGYKRMMSCCRSSNPAAPRKYRATTNPYGPGHNWVKFRFRLPHSRFKIIRDSLDADGRREPPRVAIHGSIHENKILLQADPDYIDRIRAAARNPAELAAWLDGSWDIVAGGMFDDVWDPRVHVMRPFGIPATWRIDRALDWGSSRPFSVGWWAESDGCDIRLADGRITSTVKGDLFRIHEWYGWNGKPNEGLRLLASDLAKGIRERELLWGLKNRVKAGPADTGIWDIDGGESIAMSMSKHVKVNGEMVPGVEWERADKSPGSRKNGWEAVRQALMNAKREGGSPRERPGLFVFDRCEQFRRTVPVLPRDQDDPDDVDTEAEDHIGDEVRYRVRSQGRAGGGGRTVGMY